MNQDPSLSRLPPQNVEAEEAILSAILILNPALLDASEVLKPGDFYRQAHKTIFQAMLDIVGEIDLLTLSSHLRDRGQLDEIGGAAALARLVDSVPMATNMQAHAAIVKDKAIKRQIIDLNMRSAQACFADDLSGQEMLDRLQKGTVEIECKGSGEIESLQDVINQQMAHYEMLSKDRNMVPGIPTGFANLDRMLSGFQDTDLILLAARPGVGKTAIALNFLKSAGANKKSALIFSLEMSNGQLVNRLIFSEAGVNITKSRNGFFTDDNWNHISAGASKIYDYKVGLCDTAALHYNQLFRMARNYKIKHGLSIIFVDYIQLMEGDGSKRQEEISSIARNLKRLAKDFKVPVVALSQLNRKCEDRSNKRPLISDLRESGALEQDADIIMFLYRDSMYSKEKNDIDPVELEIAKFRNGPTGLVYLSFKTSTQQFYETDNHSI